MNLTKKKAKELEKEHNVYIDIATLSYNYHGYNVADDWLPIPLKWLVNALENYTQLSQISTRKTKDLDTCTQISRISTKKMLIDGQL